MKPPIRIAILECDTPLEKTRERYGGYGGVFKTLLEAAADDLGRDDLTSKSGLELSTFDVVSKQEYPDLEKIDAVLLTGSSKSLLLNHISHASNACQNTTHSTMTLGYSSWWTLPRHCSSKTAFG
jgi:hypothetical protein